jgi:hypothetical protein
MVSLRRVMDTGKNHQEQIRKKDIVSQRSPKLSEIASNHQQEMERECENGTNNGSTSKSQHG